MLTIEKRYSSKLQKLEQYVKIKERQKIEDNLRVKIIETMSVSGGRSMLTLELLELTEEYVQYKFYPEGKKDNFGIVQVNRKNFTDRFIVKEAIGLSDMYQVMAMFRVGKLVQDGEFPETSACAWY